MPNVEGVTHGFMMPSNVKGFDPSTRAFSMRRALTMLGDLCH
jgi:hypothetical protein